jgi:glutathione S-transferase
MQRILPVPGRMKIKLRMPSEGEQVMTELTIYSMVVCPYAQRTRMLLEAKDIPYKVTELDISKPRPEWFLKINPSGQVPVIEHGQRILNESSIINEYIEEVFPDPPAMPQDPYRRGLARVLIEYGNKTFIPLSYRVLMNQDPRKAQGILDQKAA